MDTSESTMDTITQDEAELYDRQIRLWGLDAQRRLRAATVLLIGMKGLGAEVAKNIILSGIKAITLMDPNNIDDEDKMSQFFVSSAAPGQNRAEASVPQARLLNPMVTVTSDTSDPSEKDDNFFLQFDVICVTCSRTSLQCRLDKLCFENNIKFFSGDVFGFYGFTFADLGLHEYLHEEVKMKKPKDGEDKSKQTEETISTKELQTQKFGFRCLCAEMKWKGGSRLIKSSLKKLDCSMKIVFTRLEDELKFDWSADTPEMKKKLRQTPSAFFITRVYEEFLEQHGRRPHLKTIEADTKELQNLRIQLLNKLAVPAKVVPEDFFQYGFGELSPVCAIVGGVLAQEVIKAVSQKDAPLNNFFLYNGVNDDGFEAKISL